MEKALQGEFEKPYFAALARYLHGEKAHGKVIFPPGPEIFKAFELTPVDQVKVVILGQDPYHGYGQASGAELLGAGQRTRSAVPQEHIQGD